MAPQRRLGVPAGTHDILGDELKRVIERYFSVAQRAGFTVSVRELVELTNRPESSLRRLLQQIYPDASARPWQADFAPEGEALEKEHVCRSCLVVTAITREQVGQMFGWRVMFRKGKRTPVPQSWCLKCRGSKALGEWILSEQPWRGQRGGKRGA